MKRKMAMLLVMAMLIGTVLAGCSSNPSSSGAETSSGGSETTGKESENPSSNPSSNSSSSNDKEVGDITAILGNTSASTKDTMVIAQASDVGTFIPYNASPTNGALAGTTILERLAMFDADQKVVCTLAESYEYEDDGMTLVVYLREGVRFHDGTEMKASDIVYTMQNLLKGTSFASDLATYVDYDNVTARDEYTVEIPLLAGVAYAHECLTKIYAFSESYMVEQGENAGVDGMVGTGSYMFSDYVAGDHITMVKNPEYWDKENLPKLETILIRFISESSVALIEMENGNVDLIYEPATNEVISVRNGSYDDISVYLCDAVNLDVLFFNCANGPTDDILVRQAISYAIDRESILEVAFEGIGYASTSFIPKDSWAHSAKLDADPLYEYSPEKAKELLKQAGYENGLTLTMIGDQRSYNKAIIDLMINQLNAVGITLEVTSYDNNTAAQMQRESNDYNLALKRMGMNGEPYTAIVGNTSAEFGVLGGQNLSKTSGIAEAEEYSLMLAEIMTMTDLDERMAAYEEAQQLYMENAFLLPLHDIRDTYIAKSNLQGLVRTSLYLNINYCYFN